MKRIFVLLDYLFLQNFETDCQDVFIKHNLNEHFEIFVLNLNIRSDKLVNLSKIYNLHIVDFSGENLFNYIYENTIESSYFMMPHMLLNFPYLALKVSLHPDRIFLNRNYLSRGIDKILSCIKDEKFKEETRKCFTESSIFSDSCLGTTLYNSDLMYGTKDFYSSLCKTFEEINKSDVIELGSHMKFDLSLNLTLLKNKYIINSV